MKLETLKKITVASALLFASSAYAVPMMVDTAATGSTSPGDQSVTNLTGFPIPVGDADSTTGLFDSMNFGLSSTEDLTNIAQGLVDTLRLDGVALTGLGDTESIGFTGIPGFLSASGISLYAVWDKSTSPLGMINFWFGDDNDTNGAADTVVASGNVTSLSATSLTADLDSMFAGFWLDSNGNNILATSADPFKIGISALSNVAEIKAVPEPSIIALFGLGLIGMGIAGRRKLSK